MQSRVFCPLWDHRAEEFVMLCWCRERKSPAAVKIRENRMFGGNAVAPSGGENCHQACALRGM